MTRLTRRVVLTLFGAGALAAGASFAISGFSEAAETARAMTPAEAHAAARDGEILLLDIRRPDEWTETGIAEHAVPLDMRRDDFIAELKKLRSSEAQPVAVICARGVRSARLTRALEDAGIAPLVDVPEGMLGNREGPGWLERGLPVSQPG